MIENAELVMQMLEMYQMYKQQVPVELEEYLSYVAKTGNTLFQWTLVKPFIREKILNVIAEFAEQSTLADIPPYPNVDPFNYEAMKTMLLERFDTFNGPPFTIQRLCELLSCPRKEYNRVDKFMRAVEKNILVVSTCELRSKREEVIVNGVPERWENGKESDINMDLVDKTNTISDASVLNGNETVESLLNELESMKTPETKLDELNTEPKDLVAQVTKEIESNDTTEESKQNTSDLITDIPKIQITDTAEVTEQINTNVAIITQESIVESTKEHSEIDEIQPIEENEQTSENPVEEIKDLPNQINLENTETKIEEPITESNNLENSELIPTDINRVEGSIIHLNPDSENVIEQDITVTSQPEVLLVKSNEDIESMDVQVEEVTKIMESEVNCDNILEECTKPTEVKNDEQDNESTVAITTISSISTEMDIEPEKVINDIIQPKSVLVNEEEIKPIESSTTLEEPQEQDENKLTESE